MCSAEIRTGLWCGAGWLVDPTMVAKTGGVERRCSASAVAPEMSSTPATAAAPVLTVKRCHQGLTTGAVEAAARAVNCTRRTGSGSRAGQSTASASSRMLTSSTSAPKVSQMSEVIAWLLGARGETSRSHASPPALTDEACGDRRSRARPSLQAASGWICYTSGGDFFEDLGEPRRPLCLGVRRELDARDVLD